jgi:A/G-specific adenine glycosylase
VDAAAPARALDAWYRRHGRDLPWRRPGTTPYHVLVAEFILQQTRIETGLPYYARFLERFPTMAALAAAPEADVIRLWSGLGYYRRARNLHATARRIVRDHQGRVPDDPSLLRTLPGIGPYTAGAIASIAYDRPEPALDGNQIRVLGRWMGLRSTETPRARAKLEGAARSLLRHASPRRINQALMDVGSAVCTPIMPRCDACPLAASCRGRGRWRARPRRPTNPSVEEWEAALHVRSDRVWLVPPRKDGLLAHLWLPPLRRPRRPLARADLVHTFSHRRWRVAWVRPRAPPRGPGRWVARQELASLPHGRLTVLALEAALNGDAVATRRPRAQPARRDGARARA